MYTTPIIDGYTYYIDSDQTAMQNKLTALAKIRGLLRNTQSLNATEYTHGWYNAYQLGKQAKEAIDEYPSYVALINNADLSTDLASIATHWSSNSDRLDLVQDLENFRSNIGYRNLIEDLLNQEGVTLITQADTYGTKVATSPAMQDAVVSQYAFSAQYLLNDNMNILGDQVVGNKLAMKGLSKLSIALGATYDLNKSTLAFENLEEGAYDFNSTYGPIVQEGVNILLNDLLGAVSVYTLPTSTGDTVTVTVDEADLSKYFVGQELMAITENNNTLELNAGYRVTATNDSHKTVSLQLFTETTGSTTPIGASSLTYLFDYNTASAVAPDIRAPMLKVLNSVIYYGDEPSPWFNDLNSHILVKDAISSVEFLNTSYSQQLGEAFFIYAKFLQSAGAVLSSIDQAISGISQRING